MSETNNHLSVVICGHVDSGKSTTTGRLLWELDGVSDRELVKLREQAEALNKSSFAFAFFMDKCKEERERGVTIQCTTKAFKTEKWNYTIIDAPGHRDFIKNMISGAAQADVAVLMIPADSNFETSIQKGDIKSAEIQGQTRAHARLLNLLGVKQLLVCVNKMDSEKAGYKEERYKEVSEEMRHMLVKVGWKGDFVKNSVPIVPISGLQGDNLCKKSEKMPWWNGVDVKSPAGTTIHIHTLLDALNDFCGLPDRKTDAPLRVPVSGISQIKGVRVITGRVEQGTLVRDDEVIFIPTHTSSTQCKGRVFSLEMHHAEIKKAYPGDNVGMVVKGLEKNVMPQRGDVIILKTDSSLKPVAHFTASVHVLDNVPNEIKTGYSPIGAVRCGRAACKITCINKKTSKEKINCENPQCLKANDLAEVVFEPVKPLVVDTFKSCEGLGRIAFLEGNSAVMLGKIVSVAHPSP